MSAPAISKRQATYEDILKLDDNLIGEIVDGELYASPRPGQKHVVATSVLNVKLGGSFGKGGSGGGGWWILVEPEIHLDGNVLVPDLAGWRRERLPKITNESHFTVVPDWVCEVLSPSNLKLDRARKVPKYAEVSVKYLWLVDPITRTLEAFRLEQGQWLLLKTFSDDDKFKVEPFEAVEFELGSLWGD